MASKTLNCSYSAWQRLTGSWNPNVSFRQGSQESYYTGGYVPYFAYQVDVEGIQSISFQTRYTYSGAFDDSSFYMDYQAQASFLVLRQSDVEGGGAFTPNDKALWGSDLLIDEWHDNDISTRQRSHTCQFNLSDIDYTFTPGDYLVLSLGDAGALNSTGDYAPYAEYTVPTINITYETSGSGGGGGYDPGTGGGGSTTPSTPRNPPVSATPSSPSGSSTVSPGKDTNFSWRISKYLDTTAYAGSQLQYRYGGNGSTYTLGNTQYDITTFTYSGGFSSNSIVQWRVRTGITAADGYWDLDGLLEEAGYDLATLENEGYEWSGGVFYSKWSDWVSFQTGDYEYEPEPTYTANVSIITPSGGTKSGTETIPFAFEVNSQAYYVQYEAQYSVDDGLSWNGLTSGNNNAGSFEVHFNASGFPAGTVKWRARARANGDWSNWATASFTVTYDGYGQIVVSYGPINKGKRGDLPFLVEASLTMVGEAGEVVHLKEATFCWRSGESNNFAEIAMQPYTGVGGSEYTLTLAPNALPYGLIQWYLKGKDTKDVETETEIYTTYILRSNIDSIALSPISTIENTENEIMFKWAFISENAQKPNKVELQFSEDGVSWGYPISVEFDQNE